MNKRIMSKLILVVFMVALASPVLAQEAGSQTLLTPENSWYTLNLQAELGFTSVLYHTIQNGENGTEFNYVTQGGQDVLLPFTRLQAGVTLGERHELRFLYQPIELVTKTRFRDSVTIGDTTFTSGTPVEMRYSFPYYRLSYLYHFLSSKPGLDLGAGASMQIRNASISFQNLAADSGSMNSSLTISQNVGLVPALSLFLRYNFPGGLYLSSDITGSYANIPVANGASFALEGSLLDANLEIGLPLRAGAESYLSARFVGGHSKGATQDEERNWSESLELYTVNYIATFNLSLGFRVK